MWPSLSICALTAAFTLAFACPTETVRMPPKKSRYRFPSTSLSAIPLPSRGRQLLVVVRDGGEEILLVLLTDFGRKKELFVFGNTGS